MDLSRCYCLSIPLEAATVQVFEGINQTVAATAELQSRLDATEEDRQRLSDARRRLAARLEARDQLAARLLRSSEALVEKLAQVETLLGECQEKRRIIEEHRFSVGVLLSFMARRKIR